MIIPGMVSATFRDKSVDDIIRLCNKAELKAVEWSENAHVMPGNPEEAENLYRKTTEAGLQIAAYGSYYRLGQQENPEAVFKESIVSAAALHAPVIRIWAGKLASAEVDAERRKKMADEAALICDIASEYGIKVALEWHKKTLTDTNESALQFLKEVGHENLYCLWQPTVALSMRERIGGLKLLGERLLNLHVYYWLDGVRRPLAEGADEWNQYLEHVDEDKDRYALMEFVMDNTEEQFLEDAKELHRILKG